MSKIKSELRAEFKKIRDNNALCVEERFTCENTFLNSNFYSECRILLVYASFGSEQDTSLLINRALADNKEVFLPRVCGEFMDFFRINSLEDLSRGFFGISEPTGDRVFTQGSALCVVPGLSFDKKGYRLGYGKGYYDKFLEDKKDIVTFGFCSDNCLVEQLPRDKTDIKMNYIVFDNKILKV